MRILTISTSYPACEGDWRGGFVHDLDAALVRAGHKVTALVPHPGRSTPDRERMAGVLVRRCRVSTPRLRPGKAVNPATALGAGHGPTIFGSHGIAETLRALPWRALELPGALAMLAGAALVEARRADAVVSHWLLPCGLIGAAAAAANRIPHIAVEHGGGLRLLRHLPLPASRGMASILVRSCRIMHFVAPFQAEALAGLAPSVAHLLDAKKVVGPMPPDPAGPLPERTWSKPLRVLFAGRLVPDKGLGVLLEAAAGLDGIRLTVAGDGPERGPAEEMVRRSVAAGGGPTQAEFAGEVSRPALEELLARHDVLVVPSLGSEGAPRILLDGMSRGLVPVASRTGGIPGLVEDGADGLLVAAGSVPDLAAALRRLAADPALCARLSAASARTAALHTWDGLLALWLRHLPALAPQRTFIS